MNKATWLSAAKHKPFKVYDAPMPTPEPHEVVIQNYAVAINPVDPVMQDLDFLISKYPFILGADAAGVITAVGSSVTRLKVGDRVLAACDIIASQKTSNAAFQLFSATTEKLVAKLPSNVSFTEGAVLPITLSTAAAGLFEKANLAFQRPKLDPKPTGKVLVVWGGASSVGSCAIQLGLGAKEVFDYKSETVVDDIVSALKSKAFGGVFDAISVKETISKCVQIAGQLGSKFVQTILSPGVPLPTEVPKDITVGRAFGLTAGTNEVGDAVFGNWVTRALENGTVKCKPDPIVFGRGLESIQAACDRYQEGVSAQKIVVELP